MLEANAAAPADQQLSDAELVLNSQLLQQLRGEVAAEEAALLSEAPRKSLEQEVQAKRLKALCWDAFEVWCAHTHGMSLWLGEMRAQVARHARPQPMSQQRCRVRRHVGCWTCMLIISGVKQVVFETRLSLCRSSVQHAQASSPATHRSGTSSCLCKTTQHGRR